MATVADPHFEIPTNSVTGVSEAQAHADYAYHSALSSSRFPGPSYLHALQLIHDHLKAETYLEIGVAGGGSLGMAGNQCQAIGIDPGFTIGTSIRAWAKLFKLPSDDYFAQNDTREILSGKDVQLAFIDGLHTFDQVFRDLLNVMPFVGAESHVILHDVYPVHALMAERERRSIFWTGDVWKVLFLIEEFLPDLKYTTIPAAPSGLMLIKGFDAKAREIDEDRLAARIEELLEVSYDDNELGLPKRLNLGLNNPEYIREWLGEGR